MSLDNALRSALVREGESIPASVDSALQQIDRRVRAHRRRRAAEACAVVAALGIILWAPAMDAIERGPDVPPARRDQPPVDPPETPVRRSTTDRTGTGTGTEGAESGGDVRSSLPARRTSRRSPASQRGAGTTPLRPAESVDQDPAPDGVHDAALPRRFVEEYDIRYFAGTHVGENAGTGCSYGRSPTGANDCIPIDVAEDESEIALRLVDDSGVPVGGILYEYVDGDYVRSKGLFCGETDGYIEVEPGAMLLLYVDTSEQCGEGRPDSGHLVVRLR